jgi:hypothetical protein
MEDDSEEQFFCNLSARERKRTLTKKFEVKEGIFYNKIKK